MVSINKIGEMIKRGDVRGLLSIFNEAGDDIITAQQLLGHTSVTTTQIYTMTNQNEKRHAVSLPDGSIRSHLTRI